jgi:uncharacterized membrane protein YsdA (DUF1294 family)
MFAVIGKHIAAAPAGEFALYFPPLSPKSQIKNQLQIPPKNHPMKPADSITMLWFAAINAATFLAFGFDKWRAGQSGRRVPEFTLVLLAALGGWPGGLLGLTLFRHKTAKRTFKAKFAVALIPFAGEVWAWLYFR